MTGLCPTCDGLLHGVQYVLTSQDYDGVSEWVCPKCRARVGRWSGLSLSEGQLEGRYGIGSPITVGKVEPEALRGENAEV